MLFLALFSLYSHYNSSFGKTIDEDRSGLLRALAMTDIESILSVVFNAMTDIDSILSVVIIAMTELVICDLLRDVCDVQIFMAVFGNEFLSAV